MNIYERFIKQLDDLIMLQGITNNKTYLYIRENHQIIYQNSLYIFQNYNYTDFFKIVSDSLLVLGYSYFDAFILDLAKSCLLINPKIINFNEIDSKFKKEYEKIIVEYFTKSLKLKMKFYMKYLKINFNDTKEKKLDEIRLIRNCIIHNNGKINSKLQIAFPEKYKLNNLLNLNYDILAEFSNFGRDFCKNLFNEADKLYGISNFQIENLI
jgi:hypothetical protein